MSLLFYRFLPIILSYIGVFVAATVWSGRDKPDRVFGLMALAMAVSGFWEFMLHGAPTLELARRWATVYASWPISLSLGFAFSLYIAEIRKPLFTILFVFNVCFGVVATVASVSATWFMPYASTVWGFLPDMISVAGRNRMLLGVVAGYGMVVGSGMPLIVFLHYRRQTGKRRSWALLLFVGTMFPQIGGPLGQILPRILQTPIPPITNIFLLLMLILVAIGIRRYQLYSVDPKTATEEIVQTMTDGLLIVDSIGAIRYVNRAAIEILDLPESAIINRSVEEVIPQPEVHGWLKLLQEGLPVVAAELSTTVHGGDRRVVSLSSAPLTGLANEHRGAVCVLSDVTERSVMIESLRQAQSESDRANRAKSEFLAHMSHELRTPLNHIIGFSQLLEGERMGPLNDAQREHLGYVVSSGEHLLSLISDVLDVSKIEAGRMELDLAPVAVHDILDSAVISVSGQAAEKSITVTVLCDDEFRDLVADGTKLRQMLFNLMSNAVKFTPRGGSIEVVARRTEIDGTNMMELSVADTGIGIDPAELEQVFRPFEQVGPRRSTSVEGTGLGLSLTRSLAELHGGQVRAESAGAGKGSRFTIVIPIQHQPTSEINPLQE
jgi:PAS domain S-box-containing protein